MSGARQNNSNGRWRGTLPSRQDTVTADVLARLMSGEQMTGLEAVVDSSTTRLAAIVWYLEAAYDWNINRTDKLVVCKDGSKETVTEYFLMPDAIDGAAANETVAWCADVRVARRNRRVKAAEARRIAALAKAARMHQQHPGQYSLFDGGAA